MGVVAVDGWMWAVLVIAMASMVGLVWWKRRARRVYVIDHVKLEMHPACVVEDRVAEAVWRAAISMTNTSRRCVCGGMAVGSRGGKEQRGERVKRVMRQLERDCITRVPRRTLHLHPTSRVNSMTLSEREM